MTIGHDVSCQPNGAVRVEGKLGKPSDNGYVSFMTYYRMWKSDYPQLKVSRPAEDICQYCFAFSNRHRYLANHESAGVEEGEDDNGEDDNDSSADDVDAVVDAVVDDFFTLNVGMIGEEVELNEPECAATQIEEQRELLLLESATHIRMARAQRALYQALVETAVRDASENKDHCSRSYTFVVDYGQNMELPVYNEEQPGCTYYYSPLSIYNLGVVNHAHDYGDGEIAAHMHCHVYHEGVAKKGANNVASLIVKTLRQLNLLRDNSMGKELNIIFDNCSGQNKNNTVLKLAAWIKQMGYFDAVNFVFLIVGHTKNAADHLFNSLKHKYRKQNIYTMQSLIDWLSVSDAVTIVPSVLEDFLGYDALMDNLY